MDWQGFKQQVGLALLLFLLVGAIDEADWPVAGDIRHYVGYALTHDYDFSLWWKMLETVSRRYLDRDDLYQLLPRLEKPRSKPQPDRGRGRSHGKRAVT